MSFPLEESIPYRILALLVLAVFYGIYLVKQWGRSAAASRPCRSDAERMRRPAQWRR